MRHDGIQVGYISVGVHLHVYLITVTPSGDQIISIPDTDMSGLQTDLLHILKSEMNFTVRSDGDWGQKLANSSMWTGLIATVLKGEADFINTALFMGTERFEAVAYALPIGEHVHAIMIRLLALSSLM